MSSEIPKSISNEESIISSVQSLSISKDPVIIIDEESIISSVQSLIDSNLVHVPPFVTEWESNLAVEESKLFEEAKVESSNTESTHQFLFELSPDELFELRFVLDTGHTTAEFFAQREKNRIRFGIPAVPNEDTNRVIIDYRYLKARLHATDRK